MRKKVNVSLDEDSLARLELLSDKLVETLDKLDKSTEKANAAADKARQAMKDLNRSVDRASSVRPSIPPRSRQW